jgi:predicted PhzF superfamily epimerase YddE/YHI9
VVPESDGFALRWFTTRNEVNLCGHATLASAHVIFHTWIIRMRDSLQTASGRLTVKAARATG